MEKEIEIIKSWMRTVRDAHMTLYASTLQTVLMLWSIILYPPEDDTEASDAAARHKATMEDNQW